ncbi:hypothetical protein D3C76_1308680 [compost metagenome]
MRLVRAGVIGQLVEQMAAALLVVVLGDGAVFHRERAQQQPGDGFKRPGQRVEQLEQWLEQAVAEADEGLRMAAGELPWQKLGEGQQDAGRTEAGQPRPLGLQQVHGQQRTEHDARHVAEGFAEHKARQRHVQARPVTGAVVGALGCQVVLRSFHGGKQRRP